MQHYYVDEWQRTYALEVNERFQAGVSGVTLTAIDAATYQRLRQAQAAALAQAVAAAQAQASAQRQALAGHTDGLRQVPVLANLLGELREEARTGFPFQLPAEIFDARVGHLPHRQRKAVPGCTRDGRDERLRPALKVLP